MGRLGLQPQAALYVAVLLFLLGVGGFALRLVVNALDRMGELISSNPDWEPPGESSKDETLLLISVLIYGQVLLSIEPPLRAFASVAGNALFASLLLAPIAGGVLYGMRVTRRDDEVGSAHLG